jgi:hypothetical protein
MLTNRQSFIVDEIFLWGVMSTKSPNAKPGDLYKKIAACYGPEFAEEVKQLPSDAFNRVADRWAVAKYGNREKSTYQLFMESIEKARKKADAEDIHRLSKIAAKKRKKEAQENDIHYQFHQSLKTKGTKL